MKTIKHRKPSILFLNYEYPPLGGGAGICTKYEADGLAKLGYNVTVLTTWFKGEKELVQKENLKIVRIKSIRKHDFRSDPIEMISYANQAKKYLKEYLKDPNNHFDLCVANFTIPGGIVAINLKKKFNIPYVIISHGHDVPWFLPQQMLKFHIATYLYIKRVCNNAERLILLTNEMKKNADNFLKKRKEKNIVIENGADLLNFYPDYKKKSKIFKIIFVGRQRPQKDPMTFLKGIKIFKDKNPNIKFIVNILGDGPLRKQMETYVEKNQLKDKVKFLGWLNKKEMLNEYQSANVQVMPSIAEAMSIATLESLSAGLYVISTEVSGNTDVIKPGSNGSFIPKKDPEAIAVELKRYYDSKFKSHYQVKESVIEDLKKKYSWSVIVNKYDHLIKELVR